MNSNFFKRIFLAAIFLLIAIKAILSQEERYLLIRAVAELEMEPLKEATVTLYENKEKKSSVTTGPDGIFSFKLDINKFYTIEVSKESYVSKRISFDTQLPDKETGVWQREFSISVLRNCEGVDYSALKEPVDIIKFNEKRRDFDSDRDYVYKMEPKIDNIFMQYDKCLTDKYNRLVDLADKQFKSKTYQEAKSNYQAALEVFPKETYPKEKIDEINALLSKLDNIENLYQKTLSEADALYDQKRYQEALLKYKGAQTLKPQETYPKEKTSEIETILAKNQSEQQQKNATETQYNSLVAKGNLEMSNKNYAAAKQAYEQALQIKPNDATIKARIPELNKLIAEQAQTLQKQEDLNKNYTNTIAQADKEFSAGNYEAAKQLYMQASALKPMEKYPSGKVVEIEKVVQANQATAEKAKAAELDKQYMTLLTEADNLYKSKDFKGAADTYNKASLLKPNESYPKQRINQINSNLSAEEAKKQKEIDAGYQTAFAAAEKAATAKDYQAAKSFYLQAQQFKPENEILKGKITEMDKLIASDTKQKEQAQTVQANYNAAIQKADQFFSAKNYEAAKTAYNEAKIIKPNEQYPNSKLQEIDKIAAADNAKKQQEIMQSYQTAMTSGNTLFTQKQYQQAKESYQKALSFKPDDILAKNKIQEADNAIAQDMAKKSASEAKQKEYQGIISKADAFYNSKDYAAAKTEYQKASTSMPEEQYPKQRIQEIDRLVAADNAKKQQEITQGYQAAMTSGNTLFTQKQYQLAKESYQKALGFKPDDILAKNKIQEADNAIAQDMAKKSASEAKQKEYQGIISKADAFFNSKDYTAAKTEYQKASISMPEEQYPKQRIQEIDRLVAADNAKKQQEIMQGYQAAMTSGNTLFTQKQYQQAKESYLKALGFKPDDILAKNKIQEADNAIAQDMAKKSASEAKQKEYQGIISKADAFFTAKNYTSAKTEYQKASLVIPAEQYPKQRIQEIDGLVLAEAQKAKDKEAGYQKAMAAGNSFFTQKSYDNAKKSYQEALTFKPEDNTAKTKITEIDNLIKQEQARIAAEDAKKKQYTGLITAADGFMTSKNYSSAKTEYQKAAQLMPDETYPKQKITEIDNILADQQKQAADKQAKDNAYKMSVAKADEYFSKKQYDLSKAEFNKALEIKPAEQYPKSKMAEIDNLLAQMNLAKEKDQNYTVSVTEGDRYFNEKNYAAAKISYNKALGYKPAETYPKNQITKIDNIVSEAEKAKQAEAAKQKGYDLLISQGDKYFSVKNYQQSKEQFKKALDLKPDETYPKSRIAKIDELLAAQSQQQKQTTTTTQKQESVKKPLLIELNFKNDNERELYLADLKKKFPAGVTVEVYKETNKVTTRVIVIRLDEVREFREVYFPNWGGREHTLNGKPITKMFFDEQTKAHDGEYYKKFEF